jgi:hypothetical protein
MRVIKFISISLFALIIFSEVIINEFWMVESKPLKGAYGEVKKPELTSESFFGGRFQDPFQSFHEQDLNLHNTLIRVRNQIDYSVFNHPHAFNIVIGKDNVLYQDFYIDAIQGKDFIGIPRVDSLARAYASVQKKFRERGIEFFLVIAPGKASFMPEYLPSSVKIDPKVYTNYESFVSELKENKAFYLDFRKWFIEMKGTAKYPLFPRTGTHWSGYSMTLVADSLKKVMEQRKNIVMPKVKVKEGELTDRALRFTDSDIGDAMNLIWPIKPYKMYYPVVEFEEVADTSKPSVLMIGDSFNQSFISFYPYFDKLFSNDSRFWFYNRLITYPEGVAGFSRNPHEYEVTPEILKRDYIIVLSTEQNLKDFCFGFLKDADNALK